MSKNNDWVIKKRLKTFFDKKSELRARTNKSITKDRILFCAYEKTFRAEFNDTELTRALVLDLIEKQQIRTPQGIRNIFCYREVECKHQPIWYKRWYTNFINKWKKEE